MTKGTYINRLREYKDKFMTVSAWKIWVKGSRLGRGSWNQAYWRIVAIHPLFIRVCFICILYKAEQPSGNSFSCSAMRWGSSPCLSFRCVFSFFLNVVLVFSLIESRVFVVVFAVAPRFRDVWHSHRFMDAYRNGLNGRQAAWASKKYWGYRVLPETIMAELEAAGLTWLAYTVDTVCLSQLVASVTHQSRWCVDHENAYSFFNHPKVKILSRLFLYSGTYSQNDGTDFATSNLKQSYKPKGRGLT
jgi:hypothetical protein